MSPAQPISRSEAGNSSLVLHSDGLLITDWGDVLQGVGRAVTVVAKHAGHEHRRITFYLPPGAPCDFQRFHVAPPVIHDPDPVEAEARHIGDLVMPIPFADHVWNRLWRFYQDNPDLHDCMGIHEWVRQATENLAQAEPGEEAAA